MTVLTVILGGLGAIVVSTISGFLGSQLHWRTERRARIAEEKKQRASLLALLADEMVTLFNRFVQYADQASNGQMSFSRPYEMFTSAQVQQLVILGARTSVITAVYQVRQLNSLVTLQIDRAHEEYSRHSEDGRYAMPIRVNTPRGDIGTPFVTFSRIFAFVDDEYLATRDAVECILTEAERENDAQVLGELRKMFEGAKKRYTGIIEERFPATK